MADDHIYEMTDNNCYSSMTTKRGNAVATALSAAKQHDIATDTVPSFSRKRFWILALAVLFNFLLLIAITAVLSHYQTKMNTELKKDIQQSFAIGSNISGPPGTDACKGA